MKFPTSMRHLAMTGAAGLTAVALVAGCGSSGSKSSTEPFPGSTTAASSAPSSTPSEETSSTGGDSSNPHALLAASVDKVRALKNSKISLDAEIEAAGQDIKFGGEGVVDYEGKKLDLTITLPAELTGGTELSIEERIIGDTAYLKFPDAYASKLGGKSWASVPVSELSKGSGSSSSPFSQDPSQILSTLQSVSDKVEDLGKVDVRGVETTHYRADVDLTKAAGVTGADTSQLDGYKELTGSDSLPEDVYLDSDGLPRRVAVSIEPAAGSSASAALSKVAFTIDFYDFGKADTDAIVAPPASEVGELPAGALSGVGS